jgi:hypothetical protein
VQHNVQYKRVAVRLDEATVWVCPGCCGRVETLLLVVVEGDSGGKVALCVKREGFSEGNFARRDVVIT